MFRQTACAETEFALKRSRWKTSNYGIKTIADLRTSCFYTRLAAPHADTPIESSVNMAEYHTHRQVTQSSLFRILSVTLHGPKGTVDTFVFLYDGSPLTLVEESLVKKLEVEGVTMPLCSEMLFLMWTTNVTRAEQGSQQMLLAISLADASFPYKRIKLYRSCC